MDRDGTSVTFVTWKHEGGKDSTPSRASSAGTAVAVWANAEESGRHWQKAFSDSIQPQLMRTVQSCEEFRTQVRGAVAELWKGMDMEKQQGDNDWMTGDKHNLSWLNKQKANEMRFRTRDLDESSEESDDDFNDDSKNPLTNVSNCNRAERLVVDAPAVCASSIQGETPNNVPTEEDWQVVIEALKSMDVEAELAAQAVHATKCDGVAEALKWILSERLSDPGVGASWHQGDEELSSRPSTAARAVTHNRGLYTSGTQPSRPGTGTRPSCQTMAMTKDNEDVASQRPGTAQTIHSNLSMCSSTAQRPHTATILKRTISRGDDGLGVSRPAPPRTPRLHSAFAGPSPNQRTEQVSGETSTRGTCIRPTIHIAGQSTQQESAECSSHKNSTQLAFAWAPEATKRIIRLQQREGLTTPFEPIPAAAWASRPLAVSSAAKELHQARMHAVEAKKEKRARAPPAAPHRKMHTLTSDEQNKRALSQYDPLLSGGVYVLGKLADHEAKSLLKGFAQIDPKSTGFVSRHELSSLLRAWQIPIGPTSLRTILDKLCPKTAERSTSFPQSSLVDYNQFVEVLAGGRELHASPQEVRQPSRGDSSSQPQGRGAGASLHEDENVSRAPHHAGHAEGPKTRGTTAELPPKTPRTVHSRDLRTAEASGRSILQFAPSVRPTTAPVMRDSAWQTMGRPETWRVAQPGGGGRMSRAITRSILGRKRAIALQAETLAEINTLESRLPPTHARKGPSARSSAAADWVDELSMERQDDNVVNNVMSHELSR